MEPKYIGTGTVFPIALERDQLLNIHVDHYGNVTKVEELMPPMVHTSDRLRMPTFEDEKNQRLYEWDQIRRARYGITS